MGIKTLIEWCDSSLNAMSGCDGCELWNPKKGIKKCYAGVLTERYGGGKGWPVAFDQPAMFPERIKQACKWPDLTGKERPDKPWLSGLPRHIFLDDMGDTFTESLPVDWLLSHIPDMEASPHVWMFLTKRPRRMKQFFDMLGYVPANFKLGTSVTSPATMNRAIVLSTIKGAFLYISAEPLLAEVDLSPVLPAIHQVIGGGESGRDAAFCHPDWARKLRDGCQGAGVAFFWKQWGEWIPVDAINGWLDLVNGPLSGHKHETLYLDNDVIVQKVGKKAAGRLLDGRTWDEFPMLQKVGV